MMGFEEDDDFEEINEANARLMGGFDLQQAVIDGHMTPEQLQQYQLHMIMQQQYAMKNTDPNFNALRVRKAAAPQFEEPDEHDGSESNEYDDESGEGMTEEELFALNKKKFAEQLK